MSELTALVNWGDGSFGTATIAAGTGGGVIKATHRYVDHGSYQASVTVFDPRGIPSFSTTGLTVTNVAANITLPASANAVQGETMVVSGSFSDPGTNLGAPSLW